MEIKQVVFVNEMQKKNCYQTIFNIMLFKYITHLHTTYAKPSAPLSVNCQLVVSDGFPAKVHHVAISILSDLRTVNLSQVACELFSSQVSVRFRC